MKNIMELAEQISKGKISREEESMKKASALISQMFATEKGRNELAEIVKISLEDAYNTFDIIPLLFERKHFALGERPMFKTHKKGIKAYWTAPNSYVPKSQNYDTEIFMQFESLGVRPECLLSDIKTGRVDSFASIIADGREAIEMAIYHKIYKVLAQTYNATGVGKDSQTTTNALTEEVLNKAINAVRKKVGGTPTIIADYDLCAVIEGFEGFKQLEAVYTELRNHGVLGMYRGCNIVYLPEIIDPVSGASVVPTDKMFVVGRKIGIFGDYGDADYMERTNMDDKSWECRIDREMGLAITRPEGMHLITITG